MATFELRDFLITCDREYQDECHGSVIVRDASDKYAAEDHVRAMGWLINLMAGCPVCEKWWAEYKQRKETG